MSAIADRRTNFTTGQPDLNIFGRWLVFSFSRTGEAKMPLLRLEYTIYRKGNRFVAMDSNKELVGVFESEAAAQRKIVCEQLDDAIWDRTKELIRHAVVTLMTEFSLEQETALYWVNSASGITPLGMRGVAKP
jgi:hypothetical protein